MACKYIYKGITYSSKEEFIEKVINPQLKTLAKDNSKKVILPIGTSGSGKSTWIKSLPKDKYTIISPDEMRVEFTGNMNDKSKDKEIYEAVKERTIKAVNSGKQVIIDATNLQKERRRDFLNAVKKAIPDVSLEYKLFELNPELAKQRIKAQIARGENRANVPDSTIDRHALLYKEMLQDIKEEPLTPFKQKKPQNQFLQLLNKDNNWVTFFIKSIIQDSAKKGYEKVLFPSGNTASKIEGHTTLEEFKKQKEDRLKYLETKKNNIKVIEPSGEKIYYQVIVEREQYSPGETAESLPRVLEEINNEIDNEINQLKQELERVEREGFGALKPIWNFYENTVTNILKKQGYSPKVITDEYNNSWYEVDITEQTNKQKAQDTIFFQTGKKTTNFKFKELDEKLIQFLKDNNIRLEIIDSINNNLGDNIVAKADLVNRIVSINLNKADKFTLPEEIGHIIDQGLGKNHTLIKNMTNLVKKLDYRSELDPAYIELYKDNEELLIAEYRGKMIGKAIHNQSIPKSLSSIVKSIIDRFFLYFKGADARRIANIKQEIDSLAKSIAQLGLSTNFSNTSFSNNFYQAKSEESKKSKPEFKYKKQLIYLKRRLKRLQGELAKETDSAKRAVLNTEITNLGTKIADIKETSSKQVIIDLGREELNKYNTIINKYEDENILPSSEDLATMLNSIRVFRDVSDLATEADKLYNRISDKGLITDFVLKRINENWYGDREINIDDLEAQEWDINRLRKWTGSLTGLPDHIARTVGSMIKGTQNKIQRLNEAFGTKLNEEIELLRKFQNNKGIADKDIYNIFIQDFGKTTGLVKPYTTEFYDLVRKSYKEKDITWQKANFYYEDGKIQAINPKYKNSNYEQIFKKGNEPLARFYKFYQDSIVAAQEKLPITANKNFIPNIKAGLIDNILSGKNLLGSLKSSLKDLLQVEEIGENDFLYDEELLVDGLSFRSFSRKLDSKDKSKDLGGSLLKYTAFANNYEQMTNILPEVRILEDYLGRKKYRKSNQSNTESLEYESNLYKMTKDIIEQQVLGRKKLKELEIKIPKADGSETTKVIHGSTLVDIEVKYNSLLKMGLNITGGITNLVVGGVGNFTEAFGGRYFTLKDLVWANNEFFKQTFNANSKLNKLLTNIPVLQELTDYEIYNKVRIKNKLSTEKLEEILYYPQKAGEKLLQSQIFLAVLNHDTIEVNGKKVKLYELFDDNGQLKKDSPFKTEEEKQKFIDRLTEKTQELISMTHGRYSSRDAMTLNKYALFRLAAQFKKWIPAAIETRFNKKQPNNILQSETEGRYRTAGKLIGLDKAIANFAQLKPLQGFMSIPLELKNTINKAINGELTELEVYNAKKTLMDLIIIASTLTMFLMMSGDDDKEFKKNPYAKVVLNQLDRLSGDLIFFVNPKAYLELIGNPIPFVKTMEDGLQTIEYIPHMFGGKDSEFKRGPKKGRNRFLWSMGKITIGVKPIEDIQELFTNVSYDEQYGKHR